MRVLSELVRPRRWGTGCAQTYTEVGPPPRGQGRVGGIYSFSPKGLCYVEPGQLRWGVGQQGPRLLLPLVAQGCLGPSDSQGMTTEQAWLLICVAAPIKRRMFLQRPWPSRAGCPREVILFLVLLGTAAAQVVHWVYPGPRAVTLLRTTTLKFSPRSTVESSFLAPTCWRWEGTRKEKQNQGNTPH